MTTTPNDHAIGLIQDAYMAGVRLVPNEDGYLAVIAPPTQRDLAQRIIAHERQVLRELCRLGYWSPPGTDVYCEGHG